MANTLGVKFFYAALIGRSTGWKQAETCRDSKASWRVGRVAEAVSLVGTV
jgi:hypothetical protein